MRKDPRFLPKFTWEIVQEVRRLNENDGITCGVLAERYGVKYKAMWRVLSYKVYVRPNKQNKAA